MVWDSDTSGFSTGVGVGAQLILELFRRHCYIAWGFGVCELW